MSQEIDHQVMNHFLNKNIILINKLKKHGDGVFKNWRMYVK